MRWLSDLIGSPDDALMVNGELARGHILGVSASSMSMSVMNGLRERTCTVTVQVGAVDNQPSAASVLETGRPVEVVLFPGSRLRAKRGDGQGDIVVDWDAAAPFEPGSATDGATPAP